MAAVTVVAVVAAVVAVAAAVAVRRLVERLGWRNLSAEVAPCWRGGWVDHHIDES